LLSGFFPIQVVPLQVYFTRNFSPIGVLRTTQDFPQGTPVHLTQPHDTLGEVVCFRGVVTSCTHLTGGISISLEGQMPLDHEFHSGRAPHPFIDTEWTLATSKVEVTAIWVHPSLWKAVDSHTQTWSDILTSCYPSFYFRPRWLRNFVHHEYVKVDDDEPQHIIRKMFCGKGAKLWGRGRLAYLHMAMTRIRKARRNTGKRFAAYAPSAIN